jgi:hypothetical protein
MNAWKRALAVIGVIILPAIAVVISVSKPILFPSVLVVIIWSVILSLPAFCELVVKSKYYPRLKRIDFGLLIVFVGAYFVTLTLFPPATTQLAYLSILSASAYESFRASMRLRGDLFTEVHLKPSSSDSTLPLGLSWAEIMNKRWYVLYAIFPIAMYYSIITFYDGFYVEAFAFGIGAVLSISSFLLTTRVAYELSRAEQVDLPQLSEYFTSGVLKLPTKVRRGNTYDIGASFECVRDKKLADKFPTLDLQAVGLVTSGPLCQNEVQVNSKIHYWWNCYFPNSGIHKINLIFKRDVQSSSENEILIRAHDVKVVRLYSDLAAPILTALIPTIPFWPQIAAFFLHSG